MTKLKVRFCSMTHFSRPYIAEAFVVSGWAVMLRIQMADQIRVSCTTPTVAFHHIIPFGRNGKSASLRENQQKFDGFLD